MSLLPVLDGYACNLRMLRVALPPRCGKWVLERRVVRSRYSGFGRTDVHRVDSYP